MPPDASGEHGEGAGGGSPLRTWPRLVLGGRNPISQQQLAQQDNRPSPTASWAEVARTGGEGSQAGPGPPPPIQINPVARPDTATLPNTPALPAPIHQRLASRGSRSNPSNGEMAPGSAHTASQVTGVRRRPSDLDTEDHRAKKRMKIDVEWKPSDNKEENRAFMVVTKELPKPIWNTDLSFRETLDKQMESAKYPEAKVFIHDLVVGDNDQHVLFANTTAGDVIEKLSAEVEELKKTIKTLQSRRAEENRTANRRLQQQQTEDEQLGIPKHDQNSLMIRQLHHRFRTVWQIAQNLGFFTNKPDPNQIGTQSMLNLFGDIGGWDLHKKRYSLCTALAHGGDLIADLLVGTSGYFPAWHGGSTDYKYARHAEQSETLYTRLFELIYKMNYAEAQWIGKAIHDSNIATPSVRLLTSPLSRCYRQGL